MLTDLDIRKLADYILRNAYSVNSTGFYNGKAGISLCLFRVARYLVDDNFEEHAFQLLQESLLSKNEDIGFDDGLSGIGYVLQYLIENEYVDADFDEFFGEQTHNILNELEKRKDKPIELLNSLPVIEFLVLINSKRKDPRIAQQIKTIFEAVEIYLSIQFFDFNVLQYQKDKKTTLLVFIDYLRLVDLSKYHDFSHSLFDDYAALYRTGRIISDYTIGFYLEKITANSCLTDYTDVIYDNKRYSLVDLKPDLISLKQRLDLLTLMKQDISLKKTDYRVLQRKLFDIKDKELEQNVLRLIPDGSFISGYGDGIARYLEYCVNSVN